MTTTVKITAGHRPVAVTIEERYTENKPVRTNPVTITPEGGAAAEPILVRTEHETQQVTTARFLTVNVEPQGYYETVVTDTRWITGIREFDQDVVRVT